MMVTALLILCMLITSVTALLLLTRERKSIALKTLGQTAGLHAFIILWLFLSWNGFLPFLTLLPLRIVLSLFSLTLYTSVLFSFHHVRFERPLLPGIQRIALPVSAFLAALFFLLSFHPILLAEKTLLNGRIALRFGPAGTLFGIATILCQLIILFQMEQTFRSASTNQRIRLKFLILGIACGSLYLLFLAGRILLYHSIAIDYLVAGAVVASACWLMILFAMVRHRLLQADLFISRQVVFTSVAAFGIGLYLFVAGMIGFFIRSRRSQWDLLITIIFVALTIIFFAMLLYSPVLQRRIKHFIHTHFYRYQYDYREEWKEFTRKIIAARDLPQLLEGVIEMISETLWINQLSLWLFNEKTGILTFTTSRNLPRKAQFVRRESPLVASLLRTGTPFTTQSSRGRKTAEAMKDFFQRYQISMIVPLKLGKRLVGMITLGPTMKGTDYTDEDGELLTMIADQAAGAIISAQLIEEIGRTKEEESFNKISSFLVHDLKNLVSSLSLALQNAKRNIANPAFQMDLLSTLVNTIEKMQTLIEKLSTLPKELVIHKEPVNINRLIREAIESSRVDNLRNVELHTELNELPLIQADGEYVKKVLVNLILNAVQALPNGRGRIEISSYDSDGYVRAEVLDDGEGMSDEFITQELFKPYRSTKKKGLGIGLFQCKTIMEAHGGKIEVHSLPQRGSQFILSFPIA
ncbi:MAG: PEP-CTERM system histidine kinase PrsK [Deltaproteobacteria bacterium]|nr:PEP-CTERM system histidine kinase PrsK [Deltaproteobacteria bacterium]